MIAKTSPGRQRLLAGSLLVGALCLGTAAAAWAASAPAETTKPAAAAPVAATPQPARITIAPAARKPAAVSVKAAPKAVRDTPKALESVSVAEVASPATSYVCLSNSCARSSSTASTISVTGPSAIEVAGRPLSGVSVARTTSTTRSLEERIIPGSLMYTTSASGNLIVGYDVANPAQPAPGADGAAATNLRNTVILQYAN